MSAPPDFTRIRTEHRDAVRDHELVWWAIALVIVCPLIGLAIGVAVFGWPK